MPRLSLFQYGDPDPTAADPVVLQALRDAGALALSDDLAGTDGGVVVSITATVALAGGARFVRHAIIGLGPSASGHQYRIFHWEALQL